MKSSTATLVHHEGALTADGAEALYAAVREAVDAGFCPKSVFTAFVELVQNLRLHGGGVGGVVVRQENGSWLLRAWNPASLEDAQRAIAAAQHANKLEGAALRQWIHDRRLEPLPPNAKGAGLGFAVMRRLSHNPVQVVYDAAPGADSRLEVMLWVAHKDAQ